MDPLPPLRARAGIPEVAHHRPLHQLWAEAAAIRELPAAPFPDVWACECCPCDVWARECRPCDVWARECRPCDVWASECCPCDVWARECRPCDVWASECCPCDVWARECRLCGRWHTCRDQAVLRGSAVGKISARVCTLESMSGHMATPAHVHTRVVQTRTRRLCARVSPCAMPAHAHTCA